MIEIYTKKQDSPDWIILNDMYFNVYTGNEEISEYEAKLIQQVDKAKLTTDKHIETRYGKDIFMVSVNDSHFTVSVNVAVSRQFLAWVFALGEGVKIVEPQSVVEQMKEEVERLMRQYSEG